METRFTRKTWNAISLAVILALVFAPLALADVVQNDITVNVTDTFTAPGSTIVGYKINATGGDSTDNPPKDTCNASDGSKAYVTVNVPAGVTVMDSPLEFDSCGVYKYVTLSSSTPGNYMITVTVADSDAIEGDYNTNPATFTLKVLEPSTPSDTTPPEISYTLNPASPDGENGWYKSSVTLTWTVTEDESPDSLVKTGCVDQNITADQFATTYSCSATSDGGPAGPVTVTIKRDATAPTISANLDKVPDAVTSWYNLATGAPTVSFTCSDDTSGLAGACPGNYTFGEGASQSYSKTIYDNAGNSASAGVSGINVDLTAPGIDWNSNIEDGDEYYFGSIPAAPTCTATDALSGPDGCTVTGYGTTVGPHTLTATAYDVAGNETVETRTYTVLAWTLKGFYQPVDMDKLNTVKGGSTVPLKFEIFAGDTELTYTSYVESLVAQKVTCITGAPEDIIEMTATGSTSLRYDGIAGQFIYNWQTPKGAGICYLVTMTTIDGSTLVANFKTK